MLVAHHLRARLAALEAAGRIVGEIVLVPVANPIGLAQRDLRPVGPLRAGHGEISTAHYADLSSAVAAVSRPARRRRRAPTSRTIRAALREAADALPAHRAREPAAARCSASRSMPTSCSTCTATSRPRCTSTPRRRCGRQASRWPLLGARGGAARRGLGRQPFDEACSAPWWHAGGALPRPAHPARPASP